MKLANSLTFLRINYDKISQQTLADKAGISRSLIGGLEKGTTNPSWHTLLALSIALEVRLSTIIRIAELLEEGWLPESPEIQKVLLEK